jgi:hypothetical protein
LAAAFFFALLPLPRRPIVLPQASWQPPTAVGAFHIHTNRSDGSGSPDDIAAAAARSGLQFIILTDHGDATRAPDAPRYHSGVLVLDAVELSTDAGHYIAIGLPQAPYPLRGEPADVVEDVRRLGGFGIVAHPDSPKATLRWRDWDVPFDGIEWLNADTEWRDEGLLQLARALVRYPFRPAESLAALLDRPDETLARLDTLTQRRPILLMAGADAHARAGWNDEDANGSGRRWVLQIPSYEASFRTFGIRIGIDRPLAGNAAVDAAALLAALKAGRVYTAIDAVASPAALEFSARAGSSIALQGDTIDAVGPISFAARSHGLTEGVVVLRKDGRIVAQGPLPELRFESPSPRGVYRVEIYVNGAPGEPAIPWVVSNPIYVRPVGWGAAPASPPILTTDALPIKGGPWHVETDPASTAHVEQRRPPEGPVEFTYRLGPGTRGGQHAALGISVGNALTNRTRLAFRARASQPMRLSVQARRPQTGERWQRSVYLDANLREIVVPFTQLKPVGTTGQAFDPRTIDTVLFVVDLTNAVPGASGSLTISDLQVER